jgi:hypothetical protein
MYEAGRSFIVKGCPWDRADKRNELLLSAAHGYLLWILLYYLAKSYIHILKELTSSTCF